MLNSLDVTNDKRYKGYVNDVQMEWLENELINLDKTIPIVLVTHIPLISAWQFVNGGSRTVDNSTEVFQLFNDHNLKLVLQGHIHWKEHGFINDRFHFITGGSIAGNGWKGRRHNTKEGFVHVKVNGEEISWEYVDHGWQVECLN